MKSALRGGAFRKELLANTASGHWDIATPVLTRVIITRMTI